ncbi:3-oxoadipate enol-lactonase [Sphingobium boeckii]|uniref:3-oxoadipate enol-lactonase n=1 Tax=Sphingobium boeckii TaxID=1082345 RepID=A0A7W9AIK9_9SPHN|nr:3-oxoadipate enol-lactonase [Sphingobium boeckii]MBB5686339.1 3-oxoadipate enol-lactonase [Sphingobium boeckii]
MSNDMVTMGDGCRIAYRFDGAPHAPVLMLSNSLGTAMAMWDVQMPGFRENFRVLRYDSRGHGLSDAPAGAYSVDRLSRDAIELLDALEIERVTFCGLSKGGMVGQWLGWRAPERLERLILANTSAYMGPPESWDERIRVISTSGTAAIADSVLQRWFRSNFLLHSADAIAPIRSMLLSTPAHGYAGCCAAIRDMDQRMVAKLIAVPTLVIAGTEDPATPISHAEFLADNIPGATLAVLEAAHLSNIEQPKAFERKIIEFCAS